MKRVKRSPAAIMLILLTLALIPTVHAGVGNEIKQTTHAVSNNMVRVTNRGAHNIQHFMNKPLPNHRVRRRI